jgi:hypothetical protein
MLIGALKDVSTKKEIPKVLAAIKNGKLEDIENTIEHAEILGNKIEPEILDLKSQLEISRNKNIISNLDAKTVLSDASKKLSEGFFDETDLIKLCALDATEIAHYFRSLEFFDAKHSDLIKNCIEPRIQIEKYSPLQEQVKSKFWDVINLLTSNSKINRKRLAWMGIIKKEPFNYQ